MLYQVMFVYKFRYCSLKVRSWLRLCDPMSVVMWNFSRLIAFSTTIQRVWMIEYSPILKSANLILLVTSLLRCHPFLSKYITITGIMLLKLAFICFKYLFIGTCFPWGRLSNSDSLLVSKAPFGRLSWVVCQFFWIDTYASRRWWRYFFLYS